MANDMFRRDAGGAAFPLHPGIAQDWDGSTGMSLRDYFAANAPLIGTDGISLTWAKALLGASPPDWTLDDAKTCVAYWIKADATYRYAFADAMLEAREAKP